MRDFDQQTNSIRDAMLADINQKKEVIFSGLLENVAHNRLPESIFRGYFLPCFIGNTTNPNWVMEWISIAGSPVAEVDIFDDRTNQVLFTVPGILHTNNLFFQNQGQGDANLADIFGRYEQLNSNIASQGMNFLFQALQGKNTELMANHTLADVNTKWMGILQRYGLIQAPTQQPTGSSNNLNDYFDM